MVSDPDSARSAAPQTPLRPALVPVATEQLLYGADPMKGIVAVERTGPTQVSVYRRPGAEGETRAVADDRLRPWLLAARAEPWAALRDRPAIEPLAGDHPLRYLVEFANWPAFLEASRAGTQAGETFFRLRSPVEQYLVASGRTLFKGMVFEDLRRLQLDIETLGLDPNDPASRIVAAALRCGEEAVFLSLETSEGDLIARIGEWILHADPDVIEGHNIFNFDLPFLARRAAMCGLPLAWGRDGSELRIGEGRQRFKAGALSLPYAPAWIVGRHVVDSYQQIQRYDIAGRLGSYALKPVIAALFPDREREVIPGDQIRAVWERGDLTRLEAYNLADVEDVDALSRLTLPTEFYQTQLIPRSFQSVATGGPGEKINDLMLRAYLSAGHSVPTAQAPRPYAGGHAELLAVGSFSPVVKCDIESLYPSIMITERIRAEADVLDAALPMLVDLTRRRLDAKARARSSVAKERGLWEGLQASYKVLINSFYGYMGYGQALFNDYDAAERVTVAGQRIIKDVVRALQERGGTPIEVDTDGVYFVPPPEVDGAEDEERFVTTVGRSLPAGIRLAHDGRFAAMLSLRLKTYALLDHDGAVTLKGSSLRNRRMERCFRVFLQDAARGFLLDDRDGVRDRYFALGESLRERRVPIAEITQWSLINVETLAKQPRLKRLIDRLPGNSWPGERVEVYERQDGELALVTEYANDESVPFLLRRLRDCAERFRDLFPREADFDAFFPPLSTRTDLAAARSQAATEQLGLFA